MMGTATTVIGCLPSYHAAGAFAPLALVLLRFMQGLALGGQWGGAILLATESAPNSKRGLYGSIAQAGVPVGALLANLAFLIANGAMSPKAFLAYGWRIPFLFSIALVGLGAFIHFRVEDTGALRQLHQLEPSGVDPPAHPVSSPAPCAAGPMRGHPSPIFEALRLYPRLIFVAAGAFVSTNLAFYILITYVVAYGTSAAVYGYMWYTRAEPVGRRHIEVHFASGNGGNKIHIVPSLRLVVAITSSAYNTTYGQRRSQEILWKILTAASRQTNSQDGRRLTGK